MVSMARPLLADPGMGKQGQSRDAAIASIPASPAIRPASIMFQNKRASCLVNPRACHETELKIDRPRAQTHRRGRRRSRRPGLRQHARRARPCGDADRPAQEIGGQFNYAKQIPGKEEFYETLRYLVIN
jgi:2,4-dienoyl-CoA reductase (NADPH2)